MLNYINSLEMKHEEINKADVAASFQEAVIDVLVSRTILAAKDYNMKKIAIAGGVAANSALQKAMKATCMENGFKFYYPSPIFLYK